MDKYALRLVKTHHMIKINKRRRLIRLWLLVLLEEGTLKLGADLLPLLLLLCEVLLQLVCRETYFGLAALE